LSAMKMRAFRAANQPVEGINECSRFYLIASKIDAGQSIILGMCENGHLE